MLKNNEAQARVKIDELLKDAGWRFFKDQNGLANIQLEQDTKIKKENIDELGENFENTKNGRSDYLLLGSNHKPLAVLEAKSGNKNPLDGKEQARQYADSCFAHYIILSNGNSHYLWDLKKGQPEVITKFLTQAELERTATAPKVVKPLASEIVNNDYIALTQNPNFKKDPSYNNEQTRENYLQNQNLHLLRPYQLDAINALQQATQNNKKRFLFEMATGTGKTLISAAVIKLFLNTGNAQKVLFLVDRLELEEQAAKNFRAYLQNDYETVIYKNKKNSWQSAEIVVTTVQSISSHYQNIFSPLDFDLIIADESHRAISGNSRAVFEYFHGYKLGLTATPKDYLKNTKFNRNDPQEWEKRQLLDTYTTFGCQDSKPTFSYSLNNGVKDGYLISPKVTDARTDITTEMLSKRGYSVLQLNEDGTEDEKTFIKKDFERKFISQKTNQEFCKAFIDNAQRDPISNEIGKSIVFCVTQNHASKITEILNRIAEQRYPKQYKHSDFAVQVTSNVKGSQIFSRQFANNNLNGHTTFLEGYKSSKTRICVTVGMMTTGYDCQDILNIVLMRPIFSPTDFIQIKGRGTRKYTFQYTDQHKQAKQLFKIFDFFANCEFFEKDFNYDEALKIRNISPSPKSDSETVLQDISGKYESTIPDPIKSVTETTIGAEGMRIDREFFEKTKNQIQQDSEIKEAVSQEQWERAIQLTRDRYEDQPEHYITLDKIRQRENIDRHITWREVLERIFGIIKGFKSKDQLLEDVCNKFITIYKPDSKCIPIIKNYLKAYIINSGVRDIINNKRFAELSTNSYFSLSDFKQLQECKEHKFVLQYIHDNVSLATYNIEC